jgi:hypothetical protein
MFSRTRVLLILGAGASAEFGLPVGAKLKSAIAQGVNLNVERGEVLSGDSGLFETFKRYCSDRSRATEMGRELGDVLRTLNTIDEALHFLSSQPDSVVLGKLAIVRNILAGERDSALGLGSDGDPGLERASATWIAQFFSMVLEGLKREAVGECLANVTVINFNYDRSLEHYLFWALQQFGHVERDIAKLAVRRMNVVRPYGSIGKLDWDDELGIAYGDVGAASRNFPLVASNIRTFGLHPVPKTPS